MRRPAWQGSARVGTSRPTSNRASTKSASCSGCTETASWPECTFCAPGPVRIAELWAKTVQQLHSSSSCEAKRSGPAGSEDPIGMGPRVPDSAESVGTAMTKAIIREIQLEKL